MCQWLGSQPYGTQEDGGEVSRPGRRFGYRDPGVLDPRDTQLTSGCIPPDQHVFGKGVPCKGQVVWARGWVPPPYLMAAERSGRSNGWRLNTQAL